METMILDQFRNAFRTGGLRSVGVTAAGGQFFVTAESRGGDRVTLATSRRKTARGFRDAGKAIALLHAIGARTFEVDTTEWSPEQPAQQERRRPDTAERQRRAHEAAAHDAWFRAEVRQALREAADPDTVWVTNDEVKAPRSRAWNARTGHQSHSIHCGVPGYAVPY